MNIAKIIQSLSKSFFATLCLFSILFFPIMAEDAAKKNEKKSELTSDASKYYDQAKKFYDQKKYNDAFPLMYKAAEMGHSDAQMHVGKMYYNGWGVGHSHEKGKEWHQKAANQGNKESIQKIYNMEHRSGSAH